MIRRLGVLLFLAGVLGACTGGERASITVGDESISRDGLIEFVVALNPGGPDELPATLSADAIRNVANTWTRDAAVAQALGEQGVVMSEAERVEINERIEAAIVGAEIGDLEPLSEGFAAIQRNVWVANNNALLDETSAQRAQDLLDDADVESRLGEIDPATSLIVAHSN